MYDCTLSMLWEWHWVSFSGLHGGATVFSEGCLGSALFLKCIDPANCSCFCAFLLSAVCEMCGIVGTREAFFSKTKRFCSVSCSRSYSSNSKKASILARLQAS